MATIAQVGLPSASSYWWRRRRVSTLGQKRTSRHGTTFMSAVPPRKRTSSAALSISAKYQKRNSSFGFVPCRVLLCPHLSAPDLWVGARVSRSPVAMDEMFELFDNELLIIDNTFHHVANRNYAN